MTPDPQTTPPAEPKYEHEETARLLAQIKGCSFICSETAFDLSAQLARADARVEECEKELAELRRDKERLDWLQCEFDNAGRRVQWGYTGKDSCTITVAAHGCDMRWCIGGFSPRRV